MSKDEQIKEFCDSIKRKWKEVQAKGEGSYGLIVPCPDFWFLAAVKRRMARDHPEIMLILTLPDGSADSNPVPPKELNFKESKPEFGEAL